MLGNIAVSCGHHPRRPGKEVGSISEYSEMNVLTGFVRHYLQMQGYRAFTVGSLPLDQKVSIINNIGCDAAIECHLNGGGGHGFETLYCPGSTNGKLLAKKVHESIAQSMDSRDRGVKEGWYHMDPNNGPNYFLKETNCPAVIPEIYFLDNDEERTKYACNVEYYEEIAKRIAIGLITYINR